MLSDRQTTDDLRSVLHWYDLLCPFCYIAQDRNAILARHGFEVVEIPFQAHPDIPVGGVAAGPRNGPMYRMLEREASDAGLPLNWPRRFPNTRPAFAAVEWTRRDRPREFPQLQRALFEAHFTVGEDLEDPAVIDRYAKASGIDLAALHAAFSNGTAAALVTEAENLAHSHGVQGTPAWLFKHQLITGLRSAGDSNGSQNTRFRRKAKEAIHAKYLV